MFNASLGATLIVASPIDSVDSSVCPCDWLATLISCAEPATSNLTKPGCLFFSFISIAASRSKYTYPQERCTDRSPGPFRAGGIHNLTANPPTISQDACPSHKVYGASCTCRYFACPSGLCYGVACGGGVQEAGASGSTREHHGITQCTFRLPPLWPLLYGSCMPSHAVGRNSNRPDGGGQPL